MNSDDKFIDYKCFADILVKTGAIYLTLDAEGRQAKAKRMMFTVLFDKDSRLYNRTDNSPCQLFRHEFPSVANIFSLIKRSTKIPWPYCSSGLKTIWYWM